MRTSFTGWLPLDRLYKMPALHTNNRTRTSPDASEYEATLDPARRKQLGQFFTGLPLGRLLVAAAWRDSAKTVIDPMAGHGDLLVSALERAAAKNATLTHVHGVEIDTPTAALCADRVSEWRTATREAAIEVTNRDAFDVKAANSFLNHGYDLVITNPPYVRYQTVANYGGTGLRGPDAIRGDLHEIVSRRVPASEWPIWRTLINGYSGLADLSIPAWILSASLVRPGGILAVVAPATWSTRNYGDVIQYLLARCFSLEYLIEDTQPGWFSDALVRTQLVIARRNDPRDSVVPVSKRRKDASALLSVQVSPEAGSSQSLIGAAFPSAHPEDSFAEWIGEAQTQDSRQLTGLRSQLRSLSEVTKRAFAGISNRPWFRLLEPTRAVTPLFDSADGFAPQTPLPEAITSQLPVFSNVNVVSPSDAGLAISQGLRTGCNSFFYVDFLRNINGELAAVRVHDLFGSAEVIVPADCLIPVLRKQSEIVDGVTRTSLAGRALDLSGWALPEDAEIVQAAVALYEGERVRVPHVMPVGLADHVRGAGELIYNQPRGTRIRELTAVSTNVRSTRSGRPPRFWYMLPEFTRRHRPDVFVPRVNQGIPWVGVNDEPPFLVDANFSTIWSDDGRWSKHALRALFNTAWCGACMETLGTPLGGGALKLEATQLKRLPLPRFTDVDRSRLDSLGRAAVAREKSDVADRLIVARLTGLNEHSAEVDKAIQGLRSLAERLCQSRQA
jgi:hypothetical protein